MGENHAEQRDWFYCNEQSWRHGLQNDDRHFGQFQRKAPAGEYTLKLEGKKCNFTVAEGENTDIGSVRSVLATVDFDAVSDKMKDGMQDFLSKLQIY